LLLMIINRTVLRFTDLRKWFFLSLNNPSQNCGSREEGHPFKCLSIINTRITAAVSKPSVTSRLFRTLEVSTDNAVDVVDFVVDVPTESEGEIEGPLGKSRYKIKTTNTKINQDDGFFWIKPAKGRKGK